MDGDWFMKYGIHLSTFTKDWSEDVFGFIPKVYNYGYDGVEFPLMSPMDFDTKKARKMLSTYKLSCTCGTSMNLERDISSEDKHIRLNGVNHLKNCIDICNELESDCLGGVLYAPWGKLKMRSESTEDIKRSLETLNEIGIYAKAKGVVIALEVLNRYESYFLNTVKEGKQYIKKIGNSNVKLHFDTFHSNIEEKNLYTAIKEGGQDIYHVHVCENDRGIPGTGNIDWCDVKKGLKDINYDRWITLESFVLPECNAGKDVFIWRKIEKDPDTVAYESIKFLKKLFREED